MFLLWVFGLMEVEAIGVGLVGGEGRDRKVRSLGNCEVERGRKIPPGGGIFGGGLMLLRLRRAEEGN